MLVVHSFNSVAQNPCDYSVNVNDSIGTYSDYMLSEKNFGGSSKFFCTLSLTDGLPTLTVQSIKKVKIL
jgi:hypothetical protein